MGKFIRGVGEMMGGAYCKCNESFDVLFFCRLAKWTLLFVYHFLSCVCKFNGSAVHLFCPISKEFNLPIFLQNLQAGAWRQRLEVRAETSSSITGLHHYRSHVRLVPHGSSCQQRRSLHVGRWDVWKAWSRKRVRPLHTKTR